MPSSLLMCCCADASRQFRHRLLASLLLALPLLPAAAAADSSSVLYAGHDLGLTVKQALAQVQATGGSHGGAVTYSVSGAGDELMFTEVKGEAVETESASYKTLDFSGAEVRRLGDDDEHYGITLRAEPGTVNDHLLALGQSRGTGDRSAAINYMDFWLVDPDGSRTRHLADLFATIHARQQENAAAETGAASLGAAVAAAAAPLVHDAAMVLPAPRLPVAQDDDEPASEPGTAAAPVGKCLLQAERKAHHGRLHDAAARWVQPAKASATAGHGKLGWRISPLRSAGDHQAISFSFTNTLPVTATLVARVILTSSSGAQQAENLALGSVAAHATQDDESLDLTPFSDTSCITDVDVTVLRACPVPDGSGEADGPDNVLACNADAASGTTTVDGITYVAGREPKTLEAPEVKHERTGAEAISATKPIAEANAGN